MTTREELLALAKGLPKGAARACLAMTDQWQFAGKATFNSNGAHSLHWARGAGGRGKIAENELQKDGKWSRDAYRLTPPGLALSEVLAAPLPTGKAPSTDAQGASAAQEGRT